MATFIHLQPEQMGFWAPFLLAELAGFLTSQTKGGVLMVVEIFKHVSNFVQHTTLKVLSSAGLNRGFRFNLLMSR